jgi:hypothetical protein
MENENIKGGSEMVKLKLTNDEFKNLHFTFNKQNVIILKLEKSTK